MKRLKRLLTKPFLILWGILALAFEVFSVLPANTPYPENPPYLRGVFHVHSHYSHDGGGSIEDIAKAANKTGLDFVIVTDHNTDEGFKLGKAKRYGITDMFIENEVSVEMGHVVSLYTHTPDAERSKETIGGLSHTAAQGKASLHKDAFQVVAHPLSPKRPWTRLDGTTKGIEVMNFDSLWRNQWRKSPLSFLSTVVLGSFNRYLGALRFFAKNPKNFEIWDHMNAVSLGHFGILGHDSHSRLALWGDHFLRWPSYEMGFSLATNIVFPDGEPSIDFSTRQKQIYKWIEKGRSAIFFRLLEPFEGFDWSLRCNGRRFISGDFASNSDCKHHIAIPPESRFHYRMRLLKDGNLVAERPMRHASLELPVEGPGTYRVELEAELSSAFGIVLRRFVPVVLYNPIYVE